MHMQSLIGHKGMLEVLSKKKTLQGKTFLLPYTL